MSEETKNKTKKKPHRRMKGVYSKIREQMEFYFSDASLHKDRFLKKMIESSHDGYVSLETFLGFNKIKQLTEDIHVVAEAIHNKSSMLQLNPDKTKVKRITQIQEPVNVDERTVYVECLPPNVNHDWVKKVFSACGKVVYVSLPRYNSSGDMKGFGFVEFETEEGAQAACQELNNPPVDVTTHAGMFPKTTHQLTALKKKLPQEQVKAVEEKAMEVVSSESKDNKSETVIKKQDDSENQKPSDNTDGSLKRARTSSEQTTDDDGTESGRSAAKRKKGEVTFNLPAEESKQDENKSAGKKRAKKRKSRSRSSDEHQSDSKDDNESETNESVPEKKQKLSGDNESKQSTDNALQTAANDQDQNKECKDSKKKKKRFRRKKSRSEKDIPELRVMQKQEWLALREEYLKLQKTSMTMLKETLKQLKPTCRQVSEEKIEKPARKEIQYIPDVIVQVSIDKPVTRQDIKAAVGDGVHIAYIDIQNESQDGFIRCLDAESAKSICNKSVDGYTFDLLKGDKESQYWAKLAAERETKLNTKSRTKKRGHQKWTDKAHTANVAKADRKHIIFDAD